MICIYDMFSLKVWGRHEFSNSYTKACEIQEHETLFYNNKKINKFLKITSKLFEESLMYWLFIIPPKIKLPYSIDCL